MTRINVIMCAGFSPSARTIRKALRRVAEKKDIEVISPVPAGAGLNKYIEELRALDPAMTLVVEGCDACCGTQALLLFGISPARTMVMEKVIVVDEKTISSAEEKILGALKELGE